MPFNFSSEQLVFSDGVYQSPTGETRFSAFEKAYLQVREKEKRILSIDAIRKLPNVATDNPDFKLWEIRRKNISRFLKYLSKKKSLDILDVGCGNGFFSHAMAVQNHQVCALDINLTELKQAALAFPDEKIHWLRAGLFDDVFKSNTFDVITFCTSFHYFDDVNALLSRCFQLLKPAGEIHIIDSPFYLKENLQQAKQSSINYYQKMGVPEMTAFFHHIPFDVLNQYHYTIMYQPRPFLNKILRAVDSPFYWIKIIK